MMRLPILLGIIAILYGSVAVAADAQTDTERLEAVYVGVSSDAAMAFLACVVQASKDRKRGWGDCPENGWTTLAINHSPDALPAIAQLTALAMDASLGEDRACLTLQRGREVLPHLRALNPQVARATCEKQWLKRVRVNSDPPRYPNVKTDEVCNSVQEIAENRDKYVKQIETGITCWPWDFN
jgi:hypothetical protein